MDILQIIRQQTGLSQYQMAEYLEVPRSTINMVERGLRKLPHEAEMKLLTLVNTINDNEKALKNKKIQSERDEAKEKKLAELAETHSYKMKLYRRKAVLLQRKLDRLKKQNLQVFTRKDLINTLKEDLPNAKLDGVDKTWLGVQDVIVRKHISKTTAEEEILTAEIEMLVGYAAVHEAIFKKL